MRSKEFCPKCGTKTEHVTYKLEVGSKTAKRIRCKGKRNGKICNYSREVENERD